MKPDYTSLEFPEGPADRPYVIVNMVASVDGKATIEGTERGLGSPIDQRLMRELRVHADVVLNGASTLRASGTSSRLGDPVLDAVRAARGKPAPPVAAVLSASGDLPLERPFFTARDFEAVVYLSQRAPAERLEALLGTGRRVFLLPAGDEVPSMLRHMHEELGARLLLVEGGPTLNGQLLDAGLLDEFFLTVGPVLVGGSRSLKSPVESTGAVSIAGTHHLDLVSATPNEATGELYLRYRVRR